MKKILSTIVISAMLLVASSSFTTSSSSLGGTEIAVIVHKDNPIASLSASEAKLSYLRKIKKRWEGINKNIRPADRKTKCAEQEVFYSKVLGMTADDVEKYFIARQYQNAEKPQDKFASDKDIIDFVGDEGGAIGYVNSASLTAEAKAKVKVVLTISN
ncbi:MAG: hypothetical protein HY840_16175 [Bacteroidetes bacterium]|nr:hypothetical protein [Bacteroidota bacterium]